MENSNPPQERTVPPSVAAGLMHQRDGAVSIQVDVARRRRFFARTQWSACAATS